MYESLYMYVCITFEVGGSWGVYSISIQIHLWVSGTLGSTPCLHKVTFGVMVVGGLLHFHLHID